MTNYFIVSSIETNRFDDQTAFENSNVTFSIHSNLSGGTFTINDSYIFDLEESFKNQIHLDVVEDCYNLTFPALKQYDNANISFISSETTATARLHVQGIANYVNLGCKCSILCVHICRSFRGSKRC